MFYEFYAAVMSAKCPERNVYLGWSPQMKWCTDNIKRPWSYDGEGVFTFKHDEDRTVFLLRWS
jgi:hypothetical protein